MRFLVSWLFVLPFINDLAHSQVINEEVSSMDGTFNRIYADTSSLTAHDLLSTCFEKHKISSNPNALNIHSKVYFGHSFDPAVIVDRWVDHTIATNIISLAACVKTIFPRMHEYRPFKGLYGGGNNVTFLNEILQNIYPEAITQILKVTGIITERMGWRPHPGHLGIRCIEVLEYNKGGELVWHVDYDSIYTISILLSDPSEYDGGEFLIDTSGYSDDLGPVLPENIMTITPKQYGGILFDSHSKHAINKIWNGSRTALVFELWPFEDSTFDDYRPSLEDKRHSQIIPALLKVGIPEDENEQEL